MTKKKAVERRGKPEVCAVCGIADVRMLSYTRLEGGERVTVCGSHKTAHQRSEKIATTVDELKKLTADRRAS